MIPATTLPDPSPDDRRLHDLYRMHDISGRLLYVGVSNAGLRRFGEHSKDKTWWREVARIDVEHAFCTRNVIEQMERDTIKAERPLYNVVHNAQTLAPPPVAPAQSAVDEMANPGTGKAYVGRRFGAAAPAGSDTYVRSVQIAHSELDIHQKWWVGAILAQASEAGVALGLKGDPSRRRLDIVNGLCWLSAMHVSDYADTETADREAVRHLGDATDHWQFTDRSIGERCGNLTESQASAFRYNCFTR